MHSDMLMTETSDFATLIWETRETRETGKPGKPGNRETPGNPGNPGNRETGKPGKPGNRETRETRETRGQTERFLLSCAVARLARAGETAWCRWASVPWHGSINTCTRSDRNPGNPGNPGTDGTFSVIARAGGHQSWRFSNSGTFASDGMSLPSLPSPHIPRVRLAAIHSRIHRCRFVIRNPGTDGTFSVIVCRGSIGSCGRRGRSASCNAAWERAAIHPRLRCRPHGLFGLAAALCAVA